MPKLEFWYEFASNYSWLSAMRIEDLAAAAGIEVVWRPFLLGPIFRDQGWSSSPFNLYPAKGRHMRRDMDRIARARGLTLTWPETFPADGLAAARLALVGEARGWVAPFTRAVYEAEFSRGRDIADRAVLAGILADLGLDADALLAEIATPEVKAALAARTDAARARDLFGAPSFLTPDGELFWGDDRLEQAITWTLAPPNPSLGA
ncbi:2-hydroxychromene-2-carboxylate isomerase [Pinisolibacter aquiterrae]|uniref:2-hydroxychromene-2-carboxylate isomerase n=1 Tax=Pinisolibacter aquiterrae TaxID=2815579 RepID=UPI001C3E48B9|nr:2-hydroxychromene-2-carboxylate isomerase [Pinisolibacter aquiterrae]MCC8233308.1 2-hydroxychromene-2-carboxylate isomerase [Pinisolibacter aquiterrae]